MRIIKSGVMLVLSALSFQAFAANPQLEANSLVKCEEASSLTKAVDEINLTVSSSELSTLSSSGSYMHMKDYTSSPPTITKLDNGNIAVCVTLTKKSGWLQSNK